MHSDRKRVHMVFPRKLYDDLKERCERDGFMSLSECVRNMATRYINQGRPPPQRREGENER